MAESPDTTTTDLAELISDYAAQLHANLAEAEALWQRLEAHWEPAPLARLHHLMHELSGSGATFGFVKLSLVAARIEQPLRQWLARPDTPADEVRQTLALEFAELRQVIASEGPQVRQGLAGELSGQLGDDEAHLVYMVSDDVESARDLGVQIGHFGYKILISRSFDELAQAIAATPPAAVLLDIALDSAEISDGKAIGALQQGRAKPIPVLCLSTHSDLSTRLRAVRAGCHAYLTKPVDVSSLVDQLDVLTDSGEVEPYRILIVEDSRQLARFYTAILEQAKMLTVTVTDPLQVMQPLTEFRPDLILMDVYMPNCSGLELARVIRQQEAFLSIPIVFLSAETDLTRQLQAMSFGGDDFLTKPIQPGHLVTAVTSRAERSRALRSFMVRDSLTGLLNHTATKEQLDRELARAVRSNQPLALAIIDIDRFKLVNDTYGHPTGDQVLKSLARLLRQRLRGSDIVGRYGGEEFAVILPETDGPTAVRVIDAIRVGFGQVRQRADSGFFAVTFSCGIAAFPAHTDATRLLDAADKMLYEAKNAGRNQTLLAPPADLAQGRPIAVPPFPTPQARQAATADQAAEDQLPYAVLVVEDNWDINRLLQMWLRARGYRVAAVSRGQMAMEHLEHHVPDLLVLDVMIPDINGLELLDYVRAQGLDTAVIVTTALGGEQVAIDAMRRGADDYLRKPFQTREFQLALERATAHLRLRRQNTTLQRRLGLKTAD
jgi:diguanylate cyclase (GGDEF)-like protein